MRQFISRYAALLLAIGFVPLTEMLVTVEWSYPYCSNPDSGSAYAARGIPLPYEMYSGVSSLEYLIMPHVYVFNLLCLLVVAYPICRALAKRLTAQAIYLGAAGLGALGLSVTLLVFGVVTYIPVQSIADGRFMRYSELRPVSFGLALKVRECKASPFWFPNGWHPR